MANIEGVITEDIAATIGIGLNVYDNEGKKLGSVDDVDRKTGYFMVQVNPFSEKELYIPFNLITNIDPRELYVSRSKDELHREFSTPPAHTTVVEAYGGHETAITTESSGYDGYPVVVERAKIDKLRKHIHTGNHVYTTEMADLGKIKKYDSVTGWMLIEKGVLSQKHDLMVPVTVVDYVDHDTGEVYLAASKADLDRMQHLEPADVVFVEAQEK
jgi:ribosomal 30S subunit maturation factor RimM